MNKKIIGIFVCILMIMTVFLFIIEPPCLSVSNFDVDWWSMYGHDTNRTGFSTTSIVESNSLIWSKEYKDVRSSLIVVDEKIYFFYSIYPNKCICLDANNGTELWRSQIINNTVSPTPAAAYGKIFFGSLSGTIYCLNGDNGNIIWTFETGDSIHSSPVVFNEKVFIGSDDSYFYCLDANSGDKIWDFKTEGEVGSSPAFYNNKIYFGSGDYNIYCLDANTGNRLWNYKTGGEIGRVSPTIFDDKIYIPSMDKTLYCLDANNGYLVWKIEYESIMRFTISPRVAYGKIYYFSNRYLFCYDAKNGREIWSEYFNNAVEGSPVIADGKLFLGLGIYGYNILNAYTGNLIWRGSGEIYDDITLVDEKFYLYNDDEELICCYGNKPPYKPHIPIPKNNDTNTPKDVKLYWVGGDSSTLDSVKYDIYFGKSNPPEQIASNQSETNLRIGILENDTKYYWYIIAKDNHGLVTIGDIWYFTTGNYMNNPPSIPNIIGPTQGVYQTNYNYTFSSIDSDFHEIYYFVDWGDGKNDEWIGPYDFSENGTFVHSWSYRDNYTIRVKAKDIYNFESDWGMLEVTIPKNKTFNQIPKTLLWLFERFPFLQPYFS